MWQTTVSNCPSFIIRLAVVKTVRVKCEKFSESDLTYLIRSPTFCGLHAYKALAVLHLLIQRVYIN